jgi:hypothetical protein
MNRRWLPLCQRLKGRKRHDVVNTLSANEICSLLNLEANATCGFVRLTFVSDQSVVAAITVT